MTALPLPLFDGEWRLMSDDPVTGTRKFIAAADTEGRTFHVKTVTYIPSLVAEANAEDRKTTAGQRWGDGRVIGRVPLDEYFRSGLNEASQQGDIKWLKRFWNSSDNAHWRVREGNI